VFCIGYRYNLYVTAHFTGAGGYAFISGAIPGITVIIDVVTFDTEGSNNSMALYYLTALTTNVTIPFVCTNPVNSVIVVMGSFPIN
jgi:hypothetical protein